MELLGNKGVKKELETEPQVQRRLNRNILRSSIPELWIVYHIENRKFLNKFLSLQGSMPQVDAYVPGWTC